MTTTTTSTTETNHESRYSFQKLTVTETFSRLVTIYLHSAYTRLFIKLACLMVIPCTFIGMIIINYVLAVVDARSDDDDDNTNNNDPVSLKNWAAIRKYRDPTIPPVDQDLLHSERVLSMLTSKISIT